MRYCIDPPDRARGAPHAPPVLLRSTHGEPDRRLKRREEDEPVGHRVWNDEPLNDDARRLLDGANYGHLSTLHGRRRPKVDPVWVGREGDRVIVTTDAKSIKAINAARDPRVALSVVAYDNPYDQLLIRGKVVEMRDDDELVAMDALSQKYLGDIVPPAAMVQAAGAGDRINLARLHPPRLPQVATSTTRELT